MALGRKRFPTPAVRIGRGLRSGFWDTVLFIDPGGGFVTVHSVSIPVFCTFLYALYVTAKKKAKK